MGKRTKEATDNLKKLEQEQDQMNPLVYEDLRQKLEMEIKMLAAQLELARQKEAN